MTVAELGRRMSSAEFSEWQQYALLEPFGPLREDERAGVVAAIVGNIARLFSKSRGEAFTPASFFPELREPEPTPMNLGDKIRAVLAAAAGRPVVRRR